MTNSEQTNMRIRDALLDLMQTADADKITAMELARSAGVSRATLYRYYGSVSDVLREMEDDFIEGMRDCNRYYISAPFDLKRLDEPNPMFVAVTKYILQRRRFFLTVTGFHGDNRFIRRWHTLVKEFFCGKLAYEGLTLKNQDIYLEFILWGNDYATRYWLEKRPDIPAEEIALIAQKMLFGPFVK